MSVLLGVNTKLIRLDHDFYFFRPILYRLIKSKGLIIIPI